MPAENRKSFVLHCIPDAVTTNTLSLAESRNHACQNREIEALNSELSTTPLNVALPSWFKTRFGCWRNGFEESERLRYRFHPDGTVPLSRMPAVLALFRSIPAVIVPMFEAIALSRSEEHTSELQSRE